MAARLKTFVTSDGLTDYVVATTSRPKALEAWGSHQDLFKTGLARETDDKENLSQVLQLLRHTTGVDFSALLPFDGFSQDERVHGVIVEEQLESLSQIRV